MIDGIEHITNFADTTMPSIQKSPVKMLNSIGTGQLRGKKRSLDNAIAALYGSTDSQTFIDTYNSVSMENGHINGNGIKTAESLEPGELNNGSLSHSPKINGVTDLEMPKAHRGLSFAEIAHLNGKERNEIPQELEDEKLGAKSETVEELTKNRHIENMESSKSEVFIPNEINGAEHTQTELSQRSMPCIWYSDVENQENEQPVFSVDPNVCEKSPTDKVEEPATETESNVSVPKIGDSKLSEVNAPLNEQLRNRHLMANGDLSPPSPPKAQPAEIPAQIPTQTQLNPNDPLAEPEAVCPECRKVFKRKVYLQRHMEREHWSTAKVFRCADCGYETKHQSNLSVHRRTHTGERPYHCGACGQRYTQGHLLKSHIRSRHNGNMVFYKLDKKGDGTRSRGRRSLCIEDQLPHIEMPPIKQPKIENLLSAMTQGPTPNVSNHSPNHANNLGIFINSTIGFMGSPFLHGNQKMLPFLGGAGGLNSSMQNGSSQLLGGANNFMSPQPSLPMLPPGFGLLSNPGAMRLPTQHPVISSLGDKSPEHQSTKIEDVSMPQDLSVKKDEKEESSSYSSDSEAEQKAQDPVTNVPILIQPLEDQGKKHSLLKREGTLESADRRVTTPESMDMGDDLSSTGTNSPRSCEPGDCKHCFMLQDLRKNVVRMLSILTPDLNIDNGINYDTDQVDQLLHEVIYSNVDEELKSK